ncbi:MAG: carboxylating nicotinate-nucleotide diphosphorylase [Bacteroidales bacterium]
MINNHIKAFIDNALAEDVGSGDYTSLAIIPENLKGKAILYVKEECILAGVEIAKTIFHYLDNNSIFKTYINDGTYCSGNKEIAFEVELPVQILLKAERLVLNIMQRMSGIATNTHHYVKAVEGTKAKILDTRKTTPGFRFFEKEAVRIGGGQNHRFGLYDMILIKDNHIDFAGGIKPAIEKVVSFLQQQNIQIPIEIEARTLEDVKEIISIGHVQRILLDNFSIEDTSKAVNLIQNQFEVESSGGITIENVRQYALCGVDYISIGALTHHVKSIDLSLKAKL